MPGFWTPGCLGIEARGDRGRLAGARPSSQLPPPIHVPVGPFVPSNSGLGAGKWSAPDSLKPLGDCNPKQEPEPTADTADAVALSLCGGLADSRDVSMGMLGGGPCPPED